MERKYVKQLLKLASKAYNQDEAPVAAIIVHRNKIIAKGYNRRNSTHYTISHAEIEAINKANKKLKDWRLNNCTMYVTMKPCDMCEKVIKESRLEKVYYLVDRDITKLQYDKTQFIKYTEHVHGDDIVKYKKKLVSFWKNKR